MIDTTVIVSPRYRLVVAVFFCTSEHAYGLQQKENARSYIEVGAACLSARLGTSPSRRGERMHTEFPSLSLYDSTCRLGQTYNFYSNRLDNLPGKKYCLEVA